MNTYAIASGFKKEIWEFNKTLFWVPIVIAGFVIASPIIGFMLSDEIHFDRLFYALKQLEDATHLSRFEHGMQGALTAIFMPFLSIAFVIQLYYFTNCLFDERRDLSIFFWRSLPVSDAQTIVTKLLTGAFVIPAIFMLAATAVVLFVLVLLAIATVVLALGFDISLWHLWLQAGIFSSLFANWTSLLPFALWFFPVFAWLMLASSFASKAPVLWAILPVVALLAIESFIVAYFHLDTRFFADSLLHYFQFTREMLPMDNDSIQSKFFGFALLSEKVSLVGTILGAVFIYAAYWLRVNRNGD